MRIMEHMEGGKKKSSKDENQNRASFRIMELMEGGKKKSSKDENQNRAGFNETEIEGETDNE